MTATPSREWGFPVADSPVNGSPSPSPSSSPTSLLLGFRQPVEEPWQPTPSPASPSEPTTDGPALGSVPDELPDEWSEPEPGDTSSPASATPAGKPGKLPTQLRDTFRTGVILASATVHRVAVRTQGQVEAGLYLADETDAENIGDPLARLAHRHSGVGGVVNPDVQDVISALMGVAAFASKQVVVAQHAKRLDAGRTAGQVVPDGAGEAAA
jgi:hypothetical protein